MHLAQWTACGPKGSSTEEEDLDTLMYNTPYKVYRRTLQYIPMFIGYLIFLLIIVSFNFKIFQNQRTIIYQIQLFDFCKSEVMNPKNHSRNHQGLLITVLFTLVYTSVGHLSYFSP